MRSNVHSCFGRRDNKVTTDPPGNEDEKKKDPKIKKIHATGKGCINKDGVCTARFPREVFPHTTVDLKTGHLNAKKLESSINDVSPTVTCTNRCNTDARCLLSGTSVKAVVGYVTDYITKSWLKTHQVFQALHDSFSRNEAVLSQPNEDRPGNGARKMLTKLVNALSSKMEIGAPMAALYLLRHPDHYTSHQFVRFYWKNYVNYVDAQWKSLLDIAEPMEGVNPNVDLEKQEEEDDYDDEQLPPMEGERNEETVRMTRSNGLFFATSNTDDYRHRPSQLAHISLYDFVQCSIKHPLRAVRNPRRDLRWFHFTDDHPQRNTHAIALDPDRRTKYVPNFIGPSLPRRDKGDREEYCRTMLTLFCPWRTGIDLRSADVSWEETFNQYEFTERERELMDNFNMRYECYDARDDYTAMLKSAGLGTNKDGDDDDDDEGDELYADNGENDEDDDTLSAGILGKATSTIKNANAAMLVALKSAGWKPLEKVLNSTSRSLGLPRVALDAALQSGAWNNIIKVEKLRAWKRKMGAMARNAQMGEERDKIPHSQGGQVKNDAYVVSASYLSKDYVPAQVEWSDVMKRIIGESRLNDGQQKAFRIVANHALCIDPPQLLMHLGGLGGTGKSTVIRALCQFFEARDETYRFVLLGPTGTSAALIGGSTYHTYLGIITGKTKRDSSAKIEEVRE
ncbi:hypothetical protein DFP72DRAFT_804062, partial [Ephemerocybe angulata]